MTSVNFYESNGIKKPKVNVYGWEKPFRMLMYAPSGTGKNDHLINLIDELQDDFDKVIFIVKTPDEDFYNLIREKYDPEYFQIVEETPDAKELDGRTLLVLDDQVAEKGKNSNAGNNKNNFIFGRKMGTSVVFLTQKYSGKEGTDILIRGNCTVIQFKNPEKGDGLSLKHDLCIDDDIIRSSYRDWVCVNKKIPLQTEFVKIINKHGKEVTEERTKDNGRVYLMK